MTHSHNSESLCQVLRSGRITFSDTMIRKGETLFIIALFAASFNYLTIDMVTLLSWGDLGLISEIGDWFQ